MEIINSFFCSISAFFFKNIFGFILFILIIYLLYNYLIRKLNKISNILFFIFVILITAGGLVIVSLPSKENIMSSNVITSYYLGPVEFIITIALVISILLSKMDNQAMTEKKEKIVKKNYKKPLIEDSEHKEVKENKSKAIKRKPIEKKNKIVEKKNKLVERKKTIKKSKNDKKETSKNK